MNDIAEIIQGNMDSINQLSPDKKREVLKLLEDYENAKTKEKARTSFLPFVKLSLIKCFIVLIMDFCRF